MSPRLGHHNRRHITLELIRKRAEHNEGLVSTLEEIALHQEELEAIGPILGRTSGKTLRILLLQNNVIDCMEPADLKHFKRLEYLNLAINNISMVQGISHMEFLEKLDLTLNFIHLDSLKQSMEHLATLRSLKELYLMGNPCYYNGQEDKVHRQQHGCWSGYRDYVIAKLPQIISLDGKSITRSERNKARRMLPQLEVELSCLVQECKSDTTLLVQEVNSELEDTNHEDDPTLHCPQVRLQMSHEVAAQKAAKEKAQRANEPQIKGEQEALEEQQLVLERERARKREENGEIRQCNEGKWDFHWEEDPKSASISLLIAIPKHLSTSLIDVDVHPTYVSIVIKGKILRLCLPVEVVAHKSVAQRSAATGKLCISMPRSLVKQGPGSYVHEVKVATAPIQAVSTIHRQNTSTNGRTTLGATMVNESFKANGICLDMNESSSRRIGPMACKDWTQEAEEVPPLM